MLATGGLIRRMMPRFPLRPLQAASSATTRSQPSTRTMAIADPDEVGIRRIDDLDTFGDPRTKRSRNGDLGLEGERPFTSVNGIELLL
jgi:hypothetical protein